MKTSEPLNLGNTNPAISEELPIDEVKLSILKRLKEHPSSISDEILLNLVGRRTILQVRLKDLERLRLVKRDVKGRKQIFSITKKAEKLLEIQE